MSKTIYVSIYFIHISNAYSTIINNTIDRNKSCFFPISVFKKKKEENKRQRKPKGQSRMVNPEKLATLDTQNA